MTLHYPNHKKKESLSHLIIKNIPESSPPQHVLLYLHQFFNCKIITNSSLPPVAPGEPIDCHAVFPLMWQKMSRIIAVAAGIVATMLADGTSSPAVIGDYRVPNWAEIKTRVSLQEKKKTLSKQKEMSRQTDLLYIHSQQMTMRSQTASVSQADHSCGDCRPDSRSPASGPEANSSASLRKEFLHRCYSADNWYIILSPVRRMHRIACIDTYRALYRHCIDTV